jgi:hypothetical protein
MFDCGLRIESRKNQVPKNQVPDTAHCVSSPELV